jgi:hypothetical protein
VSERHWVIRVWSPAGTKDFYSSLCVQTGSGVHPASYPVGTGGPFPGGKAWPGCDADHSLPSSAEVMKELEIYILSPKAAPWHVVGLLYFTYSIVCTHILYLFRHINFYKIYLNYQNSIIIWICLTSSTTGKTNEDKKPVPLFHRYECRPVAAKQFSSSAVRNYIPCVVKYPSHQRNVSNKSWIC